MQKDIVISEAFSDVFDVENNKEVVRSDEEFVNNNADDLNEVVRVTVPIQSQIRGQSCLS